MIFREIRIFKYGPLKDYTLELLPGVNIIYGENEAGKTLVIDAVLRFLMDKAETLFAPINRVREIPEGFVLIETDNGINKIGKGQQLKDISDISPQQLRNIFVIRNSELNMHQESSFYTNFTERIMGLRTSFIDKVIEVLRKKGFLTPTDQISDKQPEKLNSVKKETEKLTAEIDEYIENNKDMEEKEAEIASLTAACKDLRQKMQSLSNAYKRDLCLSLNNCFKELKKSQLEYDALIDFSQEELNELRNLERQVEQDREMLNDLKQEIEDYEKEKEKLDKKINNVGNTKNRLTNILQQEGENLLEKVRETSNFFENKKSSLERIFNLSRQLFILSILLIFGSIIFNGEIYALSFSSFLAVCSLAAYYLSGRNMSSLENEKKNLLHKGAELGFRANDLTSLFHSLLQVKERIHRLSELKDKYDQKHYQLYSSISHRKKDLEAVEKKISDCLEKTADIMGRVGVRNTSDYEKRIKEKEALNETILKEKSVLGTHLGEDSKKWENKLEELQKEVDFEDKTEYDEAYYFETFERLQEKEKLLSEYENEVLQHKKNLEFFEKKAQDLRLPDFVSTDPTLIHIVGLKSLQQLKESLLKAAGEIEENAEISRKAIKYLEEIRSKEHQKINSIFRKGKADKFLKLITDNNLESIEYSSEEETLLITKGSDYLKPHQLSHGGYDQLYFSVRLALAEQLMSSKRGFFIMDEAFLASDSKRLQKQFQILEKIAAESWQVVYFTAKNEIKEKAKDFKFPVMELKAFS